jgi:hypothetical protein
VGPRTGLDRCGKSRPPPGFDPRTVQPVAIPSELSRHTRPNKSPVLNLKINNLVPIGNASGRKAYIQFSESAKISPFSDIKKYRFLC